MDERSTPSPLIFIYSWYHTNNTIFFSRKENYCYVFCICRNLNIIFCFNLGADFTNTIRVTFGHLAATRPQLMSHSRHNSTDKKCCRYCDFVNYCREILDNCESFSRLGNFRLLFFSDVYEGMAHSNYIFVCEIAVNIRQIDRKWIPSRNVMIFLVVQKR